MNPRWVDVIHTVRAPACCKNNSSFTDLAKKGIRHDLQTKGRPNKDNQPAGFIF